VPLSRDLWLVDMVRALDLPVVLTVGIKLGCINHALLTMKEMKRAGVRSLAWIANVVESELYALPTVVATVRDHLTIPLLGTLPFMAARQPAESDRAFDEIASQLIGLLEHENH
jgi:dethiobiotin synthetase